MLSWRMGVLSRMFGTVVAAWFAVAGFGVNAANGSVSWTIPSSETVNIVAGESVTWNGNLSTHPLRETDSTFAIAGSTLLSATGSSFLRTFSLAGTYYFVCANHPSLMRTTVIVAAACVPPVNTAALDIDGDGTVNANTDGLLVVRYLLGLRDDSLVTGAVAACRKRNTTLLIEEYLATSVVP